METAILHKKPTMSKRAPLTEKMRALALNDQGIAFDPNSGISFRVNQTALLIIRAWQAGKEDRDVVDDLVDAYGVMIGEAARDVAEFRARMHSLGL